MMRRLCLVLSVALTGCQLIPTPQPGPDAHFLIRTRNDPNGDLAIQLESATSGGGGGLLGGGTFCMTTDIPWTLKIGPADHGESLGEMAILLTSEQLVNPASVEMWIDIRPDGQVLTGPGEPAWAVPLLGQPACALREAGPPVVRDGWPSLTLDFPTLTEPPVAQGNPPGIANVEGAWDLLPQDVGGDWQLLETDPNPSPAQLGEWARDLGFAVVFDAAVAVAQSAGQNQAAVTVLAAPGQRLDPLQDNGPALAERWIGAYGCDNPRQIALAGVIVEVLDPSRTCLSPQYLLVFEGQLVVIQDDLTRLPLDASSFGPLVAAIMERAE